MLVDDDWDFVESARTALEKALPEGNKLIVARDGSQALDFFEKSFPAIIILDMMLPKRSGFLVAEKILRSCDPKPFIIMVTANEGSRHRAYAQVLGIQKYMVKPFGMKALVEEVLAAIQKL